MKTKDLVQYQCKELIKFGFEGMGYCTFGNIGLKKQIILINYDASPDKNGKFYIYRKFEDWTKLPVKEEFLDEKEMKQFLEELKIKLI